MGPQKDLKTRLKYLIKTLMNAIDIQYDLVDESCEVYGDTFDVIATVEVASAVVGPHILDQHWEIDEPWAGVGFGIERLAMVKEKYAQVRRVGRSLTYLDGARLNI
jgi:phenylalanyl-tRNA synthetase alpha chain